MKGQFSIASKSPVVERQATFEMKRTGHLSLSELDLLPAEGKQKYSGGVNPDCCELRFVVGMVERTFRTKQARLMDAIGKGRGCERPLPKTRMKAAKYESRRRRD